MTIAGKCWVVSIIFAVLAMIAFIFNAPYWDTLLIVISMTCLLTGLFADYMENHYED